MNPKADFYFNQSGQWQEALDELRALILDCDLKETVKWGTPCYTLGNSNIVLIHHFKAYCALLFFKGVLLKDPHKKLIQQTENVQIPRQMRFTNAIEVIEQQAIIKALVKEAIEVEKSGLKVTLKQTEAFKMPLEFKNKMQKMPALKKAFETLTPGRQRAYLLYFSSAKQVKTREDRIVKYMPKILAGKGIDD